MVTLGSTLRRADASLVLMASLDVCPVEGDDLAGGVERVLGTDAVAWAAGTLGFTSLWLGVDLDLEYDDVAPEAGVIPECSMFMNKDMNPQARTPF